MLRAAETTKLCRKIKPGLAQSMLWSRVCQEHFCCISAAEAKSPESCWFPWCVYCLHRERACLVNIHEKGSAAPVRTAAGALKSV